MAHLKLLVMWAYDIGIIKQLGVREVETRATAIVHGINEERDIEIFVKVVLMELVEHAE